MRIRPFAESDTDAVIALWAACGLTRPWNDPARDIERKLTEQRELFLVGELDDEPDDEIVATVMAGFDGHRGWVNYLGVAPRHRGRGYARDLMAHVEERLRARGCPKLSLQIRAENEAAAGFYRALGYEVDAVVSMGKRLIADA